MALFRRLFYRKPPDRLLEITERVYVFDCCFSTDVLDEHEYRTYMNGIVAQLRDHYTDAAFMFFNFKEGDKRSLLPDLVSQYNMTVMEYPQQYERCPLLPLEMIHHFLRSSENWLSVEGQQHILLMLCERGGWPVLAFMLAGLLLYRKQFTGEQKTLEMVYKQAPRELLYLLTSLNPQPSQLRYLQYITRRNFPLDWPSSDEPLALDCVTLRFLPLYDDGQGCRPVIRVYGHDSSSRRSNISSRLLFSSSTVKKHIPYYREEKCALVNIDIHCHVQGDVVLECIHLKDDLVSEKMIFRIMFHTEFVRSNVLLLTRDEVDVLWDAMDLFSKEFRAEVIFSDAYSLPPIITTEAVSEDDSETDVVSPASPDEFFEAEEIFSNLVEEQDSKGESDNYTIQVRAQVEESPHDTALEDNLKYNAFQECGIDEVSRRHGGIVDPTSNLLKNGEFQLESKYVFAKVVTDPKTLSENDGVCNESVKEDKKGEYNDHKIQVSDQADESLNHAASKDDLEHHAFQDCGIDEASNKHGNIVDPSSTLLKKGEDHLESGYVFSEVVTDAKTLPENAGACIRFEKHDHTSQASSKVGESLHGVALEDDLENDAFQDCGIDAVSHRYGNLVDLSNDLLQNGEVQLESRYMFAEVVTDSKTSSENDCNKFEKEDNKGGSYNHTIKVVTQVEGDHEIALDDDLEYPAFQECCIDEASRIHGSTVGPISSLLHNGEVQIESRFFIAEVVTDTKILSKNDDTCIKSEKEDNKQIQEMPTLMKIENESSKQKLNDGNNEQKLDTDISIAHKKQPVSRSRSDPDAIATCRKTKQEDHPISGKAKSNVVSRQISSNKGSYMNSHHSLYPRSRHNSAPSILALGKDSISMEKYEPQYIPAASESRATTNTISASHFQKHNAMISSLKLSAAEEASSLTYHSKTQTAQEVNEVGPVELLLLPSAEPTSPSLISHMFSPPPPPPPPSQSLSNKNALPPASIPHDKELGLHILLPPPALSPISAPPPSPPLPLQSSTPQITTLLPPPTVPPPPPLPSSPSFVDLPPPLPSMVMLPQSPSMAPSLMPMPMPTFPDLPLLSLPLPTTAAPPPPPQPPPTLSSLPPLPPVSLSSPSTTTFPPQLTLASPLPHPPPSPSANTVTYFLSSSLPPLSPPSQSSPLPYENATFDLSSSSPLPSTPTPLPIDGSLPTNAQGVSHPHPVPQSPNSSSVENFTTVIPPPPPPPPPPWCAVYFVVSNSPTSSPFPLSIHTAPFSSLPPNQGFYYFPSHFTPPQSPLSGVPPPSLPFVGGAPPTSILSCISSMSQSPIFATPTPLPPNNGVDFSFPHIPFPCSFPCPASGVTETSTPLNDASPSPRPAPPPPTPPHSSELLPPLNPQLSTTPPPPPPPPLCGGAPPPPPPPPLPPCGDTTPAPPVIEVPPPPPPPPPCGGAPPPPPPPSGGATPPPPPPGCPPPPPPPFGGAPPPPPPPFGGAPPPPPPPMGGAPPPPPPPMGGGPPPPPLPGGIPGPPAPPGPPGGPPPPPGPRGGPPPPPGAGRGLGAGRGQARPAVKKSTLKPLHWSKVTRALKGSLWEELQRQGAPQIATEFDVKEIETLFSAIAPAKDSSGGKGGAKKAAAAKPTKVQLIDLKRAYNVEIMLTKVKMPLPDMMAAALALDDTILDADQVENLIKFCPKKEEMELLKGYTGDPEDLGKCEQFFLELMKAPRVETKLNVFLFKIQFNSQVYDFRKSLNIVNSACDEVRNSVKLKEILKKILYLGNTLNEGTARGAAVGYKLDSLSKLTDTRSTTSRMTLMHYLCRALAAKNPDLLDFHKDLVSLEASTKIQLKALADEMQSISKGLAKVKQELSASEEDGPVSEIFHKTLAKFVVSAETEVTEVMNIYSSVGKNAEALTLYFGEDPARVPAEQVTATLLNFVRLFQSACDENIKLAELERKKAQKEAEAAENAAKAAESSEKGKTKKEENE